MAMSAAPSPPVTAAVVSWNTRELLSRCLGALEPEAIGGRVDVWVVDNDSSDGSAGAARAQAPWAHVVEPGVNLGFGRAVNLVAAQTTSEWLLVANADIAITPGALDELMNVGRGARIGCVAPRLLLPDGSTQHSVHPLPTIPFTLAFNLGLPRLSRRISERLCLEGSWDPDRERDVPWAIAAAILVRRSAFEELGGFDGRQWMYAEDLDLGWRLHERGWRTRYAPQARVRHASGAAAAQRFGPDRRATFMAATYAVISRRRGQLRARSVAALNIAGAAARVAWMTLPAAFSGRWRHIRAENLGWVRAHRHGIGTTSTLMRDAD
jgi:GT2 family glycosyltransferase